MRQTRLQLQALHAQIQDAMHDTVLWLSNASAEERLWVLEMQSRLTDLHRILEHQIEGRAFTNAGKHWERNISDFLLAFENTKEARGSVVGRKLPQLAAQFKSFLAGNRFRNEVQQPQPPQPVRGSWIPTKPKPTEVPTTFPPDFPASLTIKASVILAQTVAEFPDRSKLEQLCRKLVSRYTKLLCMAVRGGTLEAHAAPVRLNTLLHYVRVANSDDANERFRVETAVINSDEWRAMLERLAKCEDLERLDQSQTRVSARGTSGQGSSVSRRQRRLVDRRKELIATLKARHQDAPARKICELIDQGISATPILRTAHAPLESWRRKASGEQSWVGFYSNPITRDLVRSYVNKVPPLKTSK